MEPFLLGADFHTVHVFVDLVCEPFDGTRHNHQARPCDYCRGLLQNRKLQSWRLSQSNFRSAWSGRNCVGRVIIVGGGGRRGGGEKLLRETRRDFVHQQMYWSQKKSLFPKGSSELVRCCSG